MKVQQVFSAYPHQTDVVNEIVMPRFCSRCGSSCNPGHAEGGISARCTGCDFVQYINPQPAIAVLIKRGNEFVLGKRISNSLGHGQWCMPCGYVEYHEDYLSAAIREVKEETTLEVRITAIISVVTNYLKPNVHSLVTVLSAEILSGEIQPGDGMQEVAWFPYTGQFPEMAFAADQHIISRYFETELMGAPVDAFYAQ